MGSASKERKVIGTLRSSFKNSGSKDLIAFYVCLSSVTSQYKHSTIIENRVCSYHGARSKSRVI